LICRLAEKLAYAGGFEMTEVSMYEEIKSLCDHVGQRFQGFEK